MKKRQYQCLGKILMEMPNNKLKVNRIKLIFFLSQQHQLRIKAGAFDKLQRMQVKQELRKRASNIIFMVLQRMCKESMKHTIQKIRLTEMMFSPIRNKSVVTRLSDDLKSPILEVS